MSARIDHAAVARSYLTKSSALVVDHDDSGAVAMAQIATAEATLALVEQQRIANLVALMQMQVECDENTEMLAAEAMHGLIYYDRTPATPFGGPDDVAVIRDDIREALGL